MARAVASTNAGFFSWVPLELDVAHYCAGQFGRPLARGLIMALSQTRRPVRQTPEGHPSDRSAG
jgi:hypothetical protein